MNAVKKRKLESLMMRVVKGGFTPADAYTAGRLRERKYKIGDIVAIDARKPRNPGFHRLAHQIGAMVAANIEEFSGMGAHEVLKRLQLEARIGCDEIGYKLPGFGFVTQFIPRSLSFASMSEEEFRPIVRAFCEHIAREYWQNLSPEKVEEMAECFVVE